MKYLLDTNILVNLLRKKTIIDNEIRKSEVGISVITKGELYYGAYKSHNSSKNLQIINNMIKDLRINIISVDDEIIGLYSKIKAVLEQAGKRLEDLDILIASTAISFDLVLVTDNLKHFSRIDGLKIYKKE